MNIRPLKNRVLIKPDEPDEPEEKTKGGIFIPETAKDKPTTGTVVSAGKGLGRKIVDGRIIHENPLELEVGDRCYYSKHAGIEIDIDGVKYLIMSEDEIYAIIY